MRDFLIRVIINAIAIYITAWLLPGITVVNNELGTLLLLGLIFGLVNAFIRPLVKFLTCPLVILTMGLFVFVINGCMLSLAASVSGERLMVENFWWAMLGGVLMAAVGMVLEYVMGVERGKGRKRAKSKNPRR